MSHRNCYANAILLSLRNIHLFGKLPSISTKSINDSTIFVDVINYLSIFRFFNSCDFSPDHIYILQYKISVREANIKFKIQ